MEASLSSVTYYHRYEETVCNSYHLCTGFFLSLKESFWGNVVSKLTTLRFLKNTSNLHRSTNFHFCRSCTHEHNTTEILVNPDRPFSICNTERLWLWLRFVVVFTASVGFRDTNKFSQPSIAELNQP